MTNSANWVSLLMISCILCQPLKAGLKKCYSKGKRRDNGVQQKANHCLHVYFFISFMLINMPFSKYVDWFRGGHDDSSQTVFEMIKVKYTLKIFNRKWDWIEMHPLCESLQKCHSWGSSLLQMSWNCFMCLMDGRPSRPPPPSDGRRLTLRMLETEEGIACHLLIKLRTKQQQLLPPSQRSFISCLAGNCLSTQQIGSMIIQPPSPRFYWSGGWQSRSSTCSWRALWEKVMQHQLLVQLAEAQKISCILNLNPQNFTTSEFSVLISVSSDQFQISTCDANLKCALYGIKAVVRNLCLQLQRE